MDEPQRRASADRRTAPVIPVVTIEDVADAVPLARALVAGGLKVIEITPHPRRDRCDRSDRRRGGGAIVGAGTVLSKGSSSRRAGRRAVWSRPASTTTC
jgi:2-dehydro-3-deoxyphosphogluconate aldolase/(4S)-4-hydroxy-2-oxoglutarate aldolase